MSSTRSAAASQHDTKPHTASSSLEADIARLTRLLSGQDRGDASNTNTNTNTDADADVEELLRRIEAAEGLADGVEERLDGIIGDLDSLLDDLEERAASARGTGTETGTGTGAGAGTQGEVEDETQIEGGNRANDAAPK